MWIQPSHALLTAVTLEHIVVLVHVPESVLAFFEVKIIALS